MSPLHYNMMVQSAAIYRRHRLLAQLVLESTVLGVSIDTQSYAKTIMATHYNRRLKADKKDKKGSQRPWGKENLAYLYALFENEVPREDYALASVLLSEFVSNVASENRDNKKMMNDALFMKTKI